MILHVAYMEAPWASGENTPLTSRGLDGCSGPRRPARPESHVRNQAWLLCRYKQHRPSLAPCICCKGVYLLSIATPALGGLCRQRPFSFAMGYNTDSAVWPRATDIPEAVKRLIDRFYNLLDDDDPAVGKTLADEIFTSDGVAYFGGQPSKGTDGESAELVTWSMLLPADRNYRDSSISRPCMEGNFNAKTPGVEGIRRRLRRQ